MQDAGSQLGSARGWPLLAFLETQQGLVKRAGHGHTAQAEPIPFLTCRLVIQVPGLFSVQKLLHNLPRDVEELLHLAAGDGEERGLRICIASTE